MLVAIILITIFACSEKTTDSSSETTVSGDELNITNTSVTSSNCAVEEVFDDTLTVSVEDGVVQVIHENYAESSCLSFGVEGVLDGSSLNIEYPKSGAECDCIDLYRLEYSIEDLETGTYTLYYPGGVPATVVVD